jgi:hypothetical protein
MDSYAIGIGIDEYPKAGQEFPALTGSRDRAISMANWLLRRAQVPQANLRLLLSPFVLKVQQLEDFKDVGPAPACVENILGASTALKDDPATEYARLVFYFSGHGHQGRTDRIYDAIVPADYNGKSVLSITVDKLTRLFQSGRFRQVLLILDCCRNLTDATAFQDVPGIGDPNPAVEIYDWRATNFGHFAAGGKASFTEVLLQGLNGDAHTLNWDPNSRIYHVRFNPLRDYVKKTFEKIQQNQQPNLINPDHQKPVMLGPENLSLAQFAEEAVDRVPLFVQIDPARAAPLSQVRVFEKRPHPVEVKDHLCEPPPPVEIRLRPRLYDLEVLTHGFETGGLAIVVPTEDDQPVMVTMLPTAPSPQPVRAGAAPGPNGAARLTTGDKFLDPRLFVKANQPVAENRGQALLDGFTLRLVSDGGPGSILYSHSAKSQIVVTKDGIRLDFFVFNNEGAVVLWKGDFQLSQRAPRGERRKLRLEIDALRKQLANLWDPLVTTEADRGRVEADRSRVKAERDRALPLALAFIKSLLTPMLPASLIVTTPHEFAPVEVSDEAGDRRMSSDKEHDTPSGKAIRFDDLAPGFYKVRLRLPEADTKPVLVSIGPGEQRTVVCRAPELQESRLTREMIQGAGMIVHQEACLVRDRESDTAFSAPHASSILNVAAQWSGPKNSGPIGGYLDRFHLNHSWRAAPDGARGGVQILIAAEFNYGLAARDFTKKIKFRLWKLDGKAGEEFSPDASSDFNGLAGAVRPLAPGAYWLAYRPPDEHREIVFALTVLDKRLTILVFNGRNDGSLKIYQFLSSLYPKQDNRKQLRHLDLLERYYLAGQFREARVLAGSLLDSDSLDPVGDVIGAHLFADNRFLLRKFADRLTSAYPNLSDGYVILAQALAMEEKESRARAGYQVALKMGLPLLGYWADKLRSGIEHARQWPEDFLLEPNYPRLPLLEKTWQGRLASFPWTAWIPGRIETGKDLQAPDAARAPIPQNAGPSPS